MGFLGQHTKCSVRRDTAFHSEERLSLSGRGLRLIPGRVRGTTNRVSAARQSTNPQGAAAYYRYISDTLHIGYCCKVAVIFCCKVAVISAAKWPCITG